MKLSQGYTESRETTGNILVQRSEDFYQRHEPFISPFWSEAMIDIRFVAGDQQLMNILYDPKSQVNNPFVINLMQRYQGMLTGFQRNHRKSIIMMPTHDDSDQICDDYNGCFKWSEEKSNFQEIYSDGFESSTMTGISLMHAFPEYHLDPSVPEIQWCNLSGLWFMPDSNFRRRDLMDCEGIFTRKWVSKRKAMKLLPDRDRELMNIPVGWGQDGKFPIQQSILANKIESLIPYDEFHYLSTRYAQVIYDPTTKQYVEWEDEKDADKNELQQIKEIMPWLVFKKMQIPTVRLGILIAGKPFYDGPNLLNLDRYPFAMQLCNYFPDSPTPRMQDTGLPKADEEHPVPLYS